jgi:hypothetical protein
VVLFTDRAKHVADAGKAYWLLDKIALPQLHVKAVAAEALQLWRLSINPGQTGIRTCENGDDTEVYGKVFDFTDFRSPGVTLYFTNDTILMPSEFWEAGGRVEARPVPFSVTGGVIMSVNVDQWPKRARRPPLGLQTSLAVHHEDDGAPRGLKGNAVIRCRGCPRNCKR